MNQSTVAIIISILSLLWAGILTYLFIRQQTFFKQFTQGIAKKDLKTILQNIANSLKTVGNELNRLDSQVNTIIKDDQTHFQKIGFVRYNPFSDTGGDQSFCLCLLDQKDDGILISSLHSREQTRIYAKVINKGKSKGSEFSKEEAQAVNLAIKKKAK
jgi:hypothetical protein